MKGRYVSNKLGFKVLLLLSTSLIVSACSNESEETISQLTEQTETLETALTTANKAVEAKTSKIEVLESEAEETSKELKKVEGAFSKYKKEMEPYEGIAKEEATAREAELAKQREEKEAEDKRLAAEKKAAEEQAAADEKARKEAEIARGYETGITFDQLARTPDDYVAEKVKFYGKVVQVMEGTNTTTVRFAVDDNYDAIMYCEIPKSLIANNRILEDDYVTLSGVSFGLLTYTSTLGGEITIPSMIVDVIDR